MVLTHADNWAGVLIRACTESGVSNRRAMPMPAVAPSGVRLSFALTRVGAVAPLQSVGGYPFLNQPPAPSMNRHAYSAGSKARGDPL